MQITGRITNAQPPDYVDQHQNKYQNVTITDANGTIYSGRIASKRGYNGGEELTVTSTIETRDDNTQWTRFKRFNPQQQTSQQAQQGPPRPPHGTNGNDMVRIRSMALAYAKDLVVAEQMTIGQLWEVVLDFTAFITTGVTPQQPAKSTYTGGPVEGQTPDDDIPF